MSDVILGKVATLEVGTADDNLVQITGLATGTDGLSAGRVIDVSPVRGTGKVKLGKHANFDFAFGTAADATTFPLFRDLAAKRRHGRYREEGVGTGKPQRVFQGVLQSVAVTFGIQSDTVSFGIQWATDGTPDSTPQS